MEGYFQLGIPLPSSPSKKKQGYTLAEVRPRPQKRCNNYFTKTFFFKIPDLVHRRTSAPVATGNRRQMALQTSQQQSDSTLKQSVFCMLSFWFRPRSPKMPLNVSELGLNIIQFISNLYVGVFLQIASLMSIPCMLEKRF